MGDVRAHLIAPAGLDVAGQFLLLRSLFLALEVEEPRLEDAHRGLTVLDLGLLVLHAHDHTGGHVGDAHGRVRRVHRLPAGARRPVDVDTQIVLIDVDMVGRLDERDHLDSGERSLTAPLVVEGADAHEPVSAGFDRQGAVGVRGVDLDRRGLDASALGIGGVEFLNVVAAVLRPPDVHAGEHLCPIGRVIASGARTHGHDGGALIVFVVEQRRDLEFCQLIAQLFDVTVGLVERVRVTFVLGHLDEQFGVVDAFAELLELLQGALLVRELGRGLLRRIGVVPECRRRRLLRELGNLVAQIVQIGHVENRFVRLAEVGDFRRVISGGHNDPILVHAPIPPRTDGCAPRWDHLGAHLRSPPGEYSGTGSTYPSRASVEIRRARARARSPRCRGRRPRSGCWTRAHRVHRVRGARPA